MRRLFGRGTGLVSAGVMAVGVLLASGIGTGCAVDAGPSTATLKDGLTILSADAAVGVSAAYKQNGRVVYLETKVGPLKEQPMREAYPNDPAHEMDARVVDAEGRTFALVIGGDHLIDPTWSGDIKAAGRISTPAEGVQRAADFALARTAAAAFAVQAGPELKDHAFHLTNMTARVPSEDVRLSSPPRLEHAAEVVYGDNGCSTNAQWAELFTAPLGTADGWLGGVAGKVLQYISGAEHSTTAAWNYNYCTGGYDEYVAACNHGPCANSSAVTYACQSQSGYPSGSAYWTTSANDVYAYWQYESNQTLGIGGGCSTNYGIDVMDVTVYGGGDANHVCNDDSARELDEIRYQRTDGNGWSGGTGGWNGSFSCDHWTHWYGPLFTDATAPNCP